MSSRASTAASGRCEKKKRESRKTLSFALLGFHGEGGDDTYGIAHNQSGVTGVDAAIAIDIGGEFEGTLQRDGTHGASQAILPEIYGKIIPRLRMENKFCPWERSLDKRGKNRYNDGNMGLCAKKRTSSVQSLLKRAAVWCEAVGRSAKDHLGAPRLKEE